MAEANAQAAIEAVAKHFSATRQEGASLVIDGKRIALDVVFLVWPQADKPRLRFDKAALRLLQRLQAGLGEVVPDGKALIFTVTAPIREWSKTAAMLADQIRADLLPAGAIGEIEGTIHSNGVRARLADGSGQLRMRVIGFVHNPDTDPAPLMDIARALIGQVEAGAAKPAGAADERWLVLVDETGTSYRDPYRHVCSYLSVPGAFGRILAVASGQVETLAG